VTQKHIYAVTRDLHQVPDVSFPKYEPAGSFESSAAGADYRVSLITFL